MKRIISISILLLIWNSGITKQYFPLADSNAVWTVGFSDWGLPPHSGDFYKFSLEGDTLINNTNYTKIVTRAYGDFKLLNSEYIGAIREYNKTWLFIDNGETTERLFYDYNVQLNDTFVIYSLAYGLTWALDSMLVFVNKLDSILIDNSYRSKISISPTSTPGWSENWIEGIGSESGLLFAGRNFCFDCGALLECYKEEQTILYNDSMYPNSCNDIVQLGELEIYEDNSLKVVPNPTRNKINIDISNMKYDNFVIEVYDISGQIYYSQETNEARKYTIDISGLEKGLYLVVLNNSNRSWIRKVLKR